MVCSLGPGSFILIVPKKLSFKKKSSSKSLDAEPNIKTPLGRPNPPSEKIRAPLPNIKQTESQSSKGEGNNEQQMVKDDTMSLVQSIDQGLMLDSRVHVGKYHVKDSAAKILISIIGKYGDIAESCKLESMVMRSHYLECLCFMIDDLRCKEPTKLTEPKLREMLAILKDVELVGINVGWLSPMVDSVKEVIELIKQRKIIEAKKREFEVTTESLRKVLELRLDDLAELEKLVSASKVKVDETKDQLVMVEQESSRLGKTIESIEAKVDSMDCKSIVGDILLLS